MSSVIVLASGFGGSRGNSKLEILAAPLTSGSIFWEPPPPLPVGFEVYEFSELPPPNFFRAPLSGI